jgi:hypothetical protein
LDLLGGAHAGVLRIGGKSTRTWIHCSGEHKTRRERQRDGGACDGYLSILQRLPQDFQDTAAKLWQFVEK